MLLAGRGARAAHVEGWRLAGREIAACRPLVRSLIAEGPDRFPPLVNLELASQGLFYYHDLSSDLPEEITCYRFLDAPTGYVPPRVPPTGRIVARRFDGSLGIAEAGEYFAGRPRLEPYRLYERAVAASSLGESLDLLRSGSVDVAREAVLEAPPEVLARLHAGAGPHASTFELLGPLQRDPAAGTITLAVGLDCQRTVLFAAQVSWLHLLQLSTEYALLLGRDDPRVVLPSASLDGEPVPCWFLNGAGIGVLIPAGEHELVLHWSLADRGPVPAR